MLGYSETSHPPPPFRGSGRQWPFEAEEKMCITTAIGDLSLSLKWQFTGKNVCVCVWHLRIIILDWFVTLSLQQNVNERNTPPKKQTNNSASYNSSNVLHNSAGCKPMFLQFANLVTDSDHPCVSECKICLPAPISIYNSSCCPNTFCHVRMSVII